jgi:hypothetical protein
MKQAFYGWTVLQVEPTEIDRLNMHVMWPWDEQQLPVEPLLCEVISRLWCNSVCDVSVFSSTKEALPIYTSLPLADAFVTIPLAHASIPLFWTVPDRRIMREIFSCAQFALRFVYKMRLKISRYLKYYDNIVQYLTPNWIIGFLEGDNIVL